MRVHAVSLAVVAVAATLGLVVAQDPPAQQPAAVSPEASRPRFDRRGSLTPGPSAICSPHSSRLTTRRTRRRSVTCSHRTPRSRTRMVKSRGAAMPSSGGSPRFSRKAAAERLAVDADSLRFLGTDIAIEEGTASLSTGADNAAPHQPVQRDLRPPGRPLAPRADPRRARPEDDPHERLEELEWMLGEWVNESDDGIVKTSCKWSDDGNFLLREFDVKVEGRIAPQRHPAHRLGCAAEAVPEVGLRRPGRVRRGTVVA